MTGVRGEHKTPGEFRISQNWIGGSMPSKAVYVPPPHTEIAELLTDFEKFINKNCNFALSIRINTSIFRWKWKNWKITYSIIYTK